MDSQQSVNIKDQVHVAFSDGSTIEGIVQAKDPNGILECTALYPGGVYKQGDTFFCNPEKDTIQKTNKKVESFKIYSSFNKISTLTKTFNINCKPYLDKVQNIFVRLEKEAQVSPDLKEDILKICSLFEGKVIREKLGQVWDDVLEKKAWKFLIDSFKLLEGIYLPKKKSLKYNTENYEILNENDIDIYDEISDNIWNKLQENTGVNYKDRLINKLGLGFSYKPTWDDLFHFVPGLNIGNLFGNEDVRSFKTEEELPKRPYNDNEDTVVNEGFTSREKRSINIPESHIEEDNRRFKEIEKEVDSIDENVNELEKDDKNIKKTSKKEYQPYDVHRSQYKLDKEEGILYKDFNNIEKVASIKKLLAGVEDVKGKEVVFDDDNWKVTDYTTEDGIFVYTLQNIKDPSKETTAKGNQITFIKNNMSLNKLKDIESRLDSKSHKLDSGIIQNIKDELGEIEGNLEEYLKEDNPEQLEQASERCLKLNKIFSFEARQCRKNKEENGSVYDGETPFADQL